MYHRLIAETDARSVGDSHPSSSNYEMTFSNLSTYFGGGMRSNECPSS